MKPNEIDVKTCIRVLRAYIDGTLETEHCDLLDDLIAKCNEILEEDMYDEYSEDELLEQSLVDAQYYNLIDTP